MRRGSVTTYADDGRRHSAGMVTPEFRSNNRQEFTVNDIGYERTGGCFVTYRKIAFAFVFFLAIIIAGAFIGVSLGSSSDKDAQDALAILSKEDEIPEKYVLSPSIKPQCYRVELLPIPEVEKGRVRFKGRVAIDFLKNGTDRPSELVLDSKYLLVKSYQLVIFEKENFTKALDSDMHKEDGRRKRDAEETKHESNTNVIESSAVMTMSPVLSNETSNITSNINTTSQLEQLRTASEPNYRTILNISGNKTDKVGGVYVIFLENFLRDGNYTLEMEYETEVDDRTVFFKNFTKDNENRLLLVSKLKPVNAPRLFPILDATKLKANFILTVLHPSNTKALSNTPLMNSSDSLQDFKASTFVETRPLSAHNLAFITGNFDSLGEIATDETKNLILGYWGSSDRKSEEFYLSDKVALIASAYAEVFKSIDWPSNKLDLVALPIDFDGLSAPGLIVVRDSLFYTKSSSTPLAKIKALQNLVGLYGQQWLGGLVDAKNWTDAWFIEGSIIYFQYSLLKKIDQTLEVSDNFLVDVVLDAMENDGYLISKALHSKVNRTRVEAFDLIDNYRKGACLISMLHAALNRSAFSSGYADFLRRWSYATTDSNAFLHALAENTTIDGKSRLDEAFKSWARQPGYPMINVTWNRGNGTVKIRQGKFNFDEFTSEEEDSSSEALWWLPLTYVTTNTNWSEPGIVWLKGKQEMSLENVGPRGNDSWIIFNVNRTGYYRVNYDESTWRSISRALGERHDDFPAAMRASLIDDALSLARQGSLTYELALDLLVYLGPSERSYAPWKSFERHAMQLDFALYETPAYPSFQEFMRKLVSMLFDEMESKIDQGSPLTILSVQLACLFEYEKCTNWAKNKWEDMKTKNENMLLEHIRETVYCIGAQRGGQEDLSYLMQKFTETSEREEKNRLLSALGCFQTPWILQNILNEILKNNNYEDTDIKVILQSYAKNPAAAQAVRRFVQENWKQIVKRFHHSYWTMKAFVMASTSLLFTEYDLNEFNAFRDENIDSLKLMGHWVALNEMKAISWIFRLKESSSSIERWFKNRTSLNE